jgi:hypothetical protein
MPLVSWLLVESAIRCEMERSGMTCTTWGIYRGFNPHADPDDNWRIPVCGTCSHKLHPWVDWQSFGCIAFCLECGEFRHVLSLWEPVPGFHIRLEKARLVEHHVTPLGLRSAGLSSESLLWKWHESIPAKAGVLNAANRLREAHHGEAEALVVLEHMIWTLIWNSECSTPELLGEYLRFTFEHPHYVSFNSKSVWIGHEVDLALELERKYGEEVLGHVYSIYEEARVKPREFRKRLGFYLPTSESAYTGYGAEFTAFALEATRRLPI